MQTITPFLWFDGKAEEAMNFYVSIFKNSKVGSVSRYGEGGPGPKGSVMSATFQLLGQEFIALNGGPMFTFSPAISFFVNCETQEEVDELWEKLSAGGEKQRCGWLKDFHSGQAAAGQGCPEIEQSHAGDAANGQARHQAAAAGLRRGIVRLPIPDR
jgi:predicted 3-demethylubiquinone-9 3-methyltransferase (glyoxalase superfamily)